MLSHFVFESRQEAEIGRVQYVNCVLLKPLGPFAKGESLYMIDVDFNHNYVHVYQKKSSEPHTIRFYTVFKEPTNNETSQAAKSVDVRTNSTGYGSGPKPSGNP
jgi:hypothetical protein